MINKCSKILLILIIILFHSCDKKVIEYYENGNVKKVYYENKEGKITGEYVEYYNNEIIKEVHIYKSGIRIDSSVYFYSPPDIKKIKKINYWKKNEHDFQINYNKDGTKQNEGEVLSGDDKFRIGYWNFYKDNVVDSIVEYVNVGNRPYTNQIFLLDSNGDTLKTKGNYYKITYKDTIELGEIARIRFELYQPYYSYSTDSKVVLPVYDSDLKEDYSNFLEVERDTFYSLKNDGIPHPEVPKEVLQNQVIEFGIDCRHTGDQRIRGVLIECLERYKSGVQVKDSLQIIERRLFFDETFYIKEKE